MLLFVGREGKEEGDQPMFICYQHGRWHQCSIKREGNGQLEGGVSAGGRTWSIMALKTHELGDNGQLQELRAHGHGG